MARVSRVERCLAAALACACVAAALSGAAGAAYIGNATPAAPPAACPDTRGVDFRALAAQCLPDGRVRSGAATMSPTACSACFSGLGAALVPLFLSAGMPVAGGAQLGRCLLPLLPRLSDAGIDVGALAACDGGLFGANATPGSALTTLAFGPDLTTAQPVRYSAPCGALQAASGVRFSPEWLASATSACLAGGGCNATCLKRTRDFLRDFAASGCVEEYFRALRAQPPLPPNGTIGGASAAAGATAAVAAAARVALAEKVVNSLLPAVASSADDLACTRNEDGAYCLAFTGALPAGAAASPPASSPLVPLPTATSAAAFSAAGASDPDPAVRCAYWARMGCCAPLVTSLGLRAASSVTTALGFAGEGYARGIGGAPSPASATPRGAAATAAAVAAALEELNDECWRIAHVNVSRDVCGGADSYLNSAIYAPPPHVHWYKAADGAKRLSGVAIAAIVIFVLLTASLCACTAYCLGRRRAARDRHVQLQEFNRS